MITVGIIGASGYVGTELVRILAFHRHVELVYVTSRTHAGKPLSAVALDLAGICDRELVAEPLDADVVFVALPHGAARTTLAHYRHLQRSTIIDLSSDHRTDPTFVYGLPELNRERIRGARRIANPGCFATALLLSLLPLAQQNVLPQTIHASGITGSTGAGAELRPTLHFSWRHANMQAYSILRHQHVGEVLAALGSRPHLHFVPYRGPFTRGIITTVVAELPFDDATLRTLFEQQYSHEPLVLLSDESPDLKQVVGTARAVLHTTVNDGVAAIVCVLDNMLKGAAAQAVQNMNIALGLPEDDALPLRALGW